ncbi:DNA-binding domain-containing protein [Sphaerotilus mobilis]|uniref:Putative DNA-binding protein n=1 Tax=Sphaerotilus mobilis TaxID=47994 RepID=A0A4Q7LQ10_9BURK|nr:DNA-binding domain-containing protein [Sphaerotilus mobilis]RZS56876.1 putative DNA-binding protein [Sphaerotilus mobilis]
MTTAHQQIARALRSPTAPLPAGLRSWNGSDVGQRFAVHRNNVRVGLVDALAQSFPVTRCLVGDDFFRAMAGHYVAQHLPQSRVMALYGDTLADFIDHFEPATQLPWLGDVAWLEHARVVSCHAADAEPVQAQRVSQALALGERIGTLRFTLQPSARLVRSRHAVVDIWLAHQADDGEVTPFDPVGAQDALIVRPASEVLLLRLPPGAAAFIDAAMQGLPLAECAEQAMTEAPDVDLSATLGLLLAHGVCTELNWPEDTTP